MSSIIHDFTDTLNYRYNNVLYSYPIDYEEYCDNDDNYNGYWVEYGNLPKFIRRYEEAVYGKNASHREHCISNTRKNVAIVHFYIDSSSNDLITKIVKTPRVSTADILSNIGKFTITTPQFNIFHCLIFKTIISKCY